MADQTKNKNAMKTAMTFLALCLLFYAAPAQKTPENYTLYGAGEGREVRLLFPPEKWEEDLAGFVIKRREGAAPWQVLHVGTIRPYIAKDKPLVNVVRHPEYLAYITKKRDQKIEEGSLNEVSPEVFLKSIKEEQMYAGVKVFLARDFDLAVLAGFGLIDGSIEKDRVYTYGLFPVFGERPEEAPASTYLYDPEKPEDYSLKNTVSSATRQGKTLKLHWEVDVREYEDKIALNGFNIYRSIGEGKEEKLNEHPVWMKKKEGKGQIFFDDALPKDSLKRVYTLRPVTVFNTEAPGSKLEYKPVASNEGPPAPPILKTSSVGEDYDRGVRLSWEYSEGGPDETSHLYVERRADLSVPWQKVSGDFSSETTYWDDPTGLVAGAIYHYRLTVVLQNDALLWSKPVYVSKKKD